MQKQGTIIPLPKYENCWLARTNPADTARVESKTFICTENKSDTIPSPKEGVKGQLGNWISPKDMQDAVKQRFTGCMKGRTMYVVPFSMGPLASPLSKIGVEITDSPYVVASMRIMTRMGKPISEKLQTTGGEFVKCLHSVGAPATGFVESSQWPCDPERTIILHKPAQNEIVSYGSGYGGNSLLGKKCFALRIGSTIARREGWLAEHMLILGITNPQGKKRYIVAAFPSACGKTNLAMMRPTLPGYKIECVGDDIAWMKFDKNGQLRAINPENGFFGVAPGTSRASNPIAMDTVFKNTLFTNVALTNDGGVYWEGLEDETPKDAKITDWRGKAWVRGHDSTPAAHPNSRFCTPAKQCPIIDPAWEDPEGVPISAILFGGRRPHGVPLVYEARNWKHGVFVGAAMRSEATAAAEHKNVLNSTNKRFQNIQNTKPSKRIRPTTISKRHYDDDDGDDTTEGSKFCDNCKHYFCFCRESVTNHPVRQTTISITNKWICIVTRKFPSCKEQTSTASNRETERDRDRERQRQRETETERERDRHTHTHTERERETYIL
ncbi:unnamed protein product [Acanthoscelides obtectus]|nr:unnamed protein product [Acanthoscelides obtectus]CAK1674135.1 Phosphoenolpyruvate carboxykinase [GTP] [Acanthoscelides obtectus]